MSKCSDTQSPRIIEIGDQTHFVNATASSTNVTWTEPEVHDNSGVYTVWSSHHPGDVFNVGTTLVTYSAMDSSGNENSISFNVTVKGEIAEFLCLGKIFCFTFSSSYH